MLAKLVARGENPFNKQHIYIADLHSTNPGVTTDYIMAITAARASNKRFYIINRLRWTRMRELQRLMGVVDGRLSFKGLKRCHVGTLTGNAVPVPMVVTVLKMVLPYLTEQTIQGPWA